MRGTDQERSPLSISRARASKIVGSHFGLPPGRPPRLILSAATPPRLYALIQLVIVSLSTMMRFATSRRVAPSRSSMIARMRVFCASSSDVLTTLRKSSMLSWGCICSAYAIDLQDRTDALRAEALVGNGIIANAVIVDLFRKECSAADGHRRRSRWRSGHVRPELSWAAA